MHERGKNMFEEANLIGVRQEGAKFKFKEQK